MLCVLLEYAFPPKPLRIITDRLICASPSLSSARRVEAKVSPLPTRSSTHVVARLGTEIHHRQAGLAKAATRPTVLRARLRARQ